MPVRPDQQHPEEPADYSEGGKAEENAGIHGGESFSWARGKAET